MKCGALWIDTGTLYTLPCSYDRSYVCSVPPTPTPTPPPTISSYAILGFTLCGLGVLILLILLLSCCCKRKQTTSEQKEPLTTTVNNWRLQIIFPIYKGHKDPYTETLRNPLHEAWQIFRLLTIFTHFGFFGKARWALGHSRLKGVFSSYLILIILE